MSKEVWMQFKAKSIAQNLAVMDFVLDIMSIHATELKEHLWRGKRFAILTQSFLML